MLDSVSLVRPRSGSLHTWSGPLRLCYCEAFGGPPWNEAEQAAGRFVAELEARSAATGFRIVLALDDGQRLLGFSWGASTVGSSEPECWHAVVTEALGPEMAGRGLVGAFELAELGVVPSARNRGVGSLLHDALLAGVVEDRAWLTTRADAAAAVTFYRNRDWQEFQEFRLPGRTTNNLLLTRRLREGSGPSVNWRTLKTSTSSLSPTSPT